MSQPKGRNVAVGWTDRRQAVRQPDPSALFVLPQIGRSNCNFERRKPVDRQAGSREQDRRRYELTPWHTAEALYRDSIASYRARDHERERPAHVAVLDDALRPGEQLGPRLAGQRIGSRIEAARRDWAKIDGLGPIGICSMHDEMPDPAETAAPRLDHGERKGSSHHGVDRGTAGRQHLGPDLSRGAVLTGDNAAA
jgi:hypothetical protein